MGMESPAERGSPGAAIPQRSCAICAPQNLQLSANLERQRHAPGRMQRGPHAPHRSGAASSCSTSRTACCASSRRRCAPDAEGLHRRAGRLPGGTPRRRQRRPGGPDRRRRTAGAHQLDPRHKLAKTYWVQVEGDAVGDGSSRRCGAASTSATFMTRPITARAIAEPAALWPRDPPIRVRQAIPTAWLELTTRRRPQSAGAADDRGGRACPTLRLIRCGGRSVDARHASRRVNGGRPPSRRVLTSAPADRCPLRALPDRCALEFRPISPHPRPMIRRLLARLMPGRPTTRPAHLRPRRASGAPRPVVARRARRSPRSCRRPGSRRSSSAARCATCCSASTPKDFDIATDATPEQVKPLFRRAFIIGRRFRLVHVHVGAEVIEVSTFRAAQTGDDATDEHGRLLSDNVYGSQAEDAARRDFTINALYFDPATEEVWDYVGGVADIRARRAEADRRAGRRASARIRCGCCAPCASPRSSASRSIRRPPRRSRSSRR